MNTTNRSSYLTLNTPLDQSVKRGYKFNLRQLKGEETLCGDFSYELEVATPERLTEEDIDKLVGDKITVEIGYDLNDKASFRYINGMVFKLRELGMSRAPLLPDVWQYQLEVGSWFKQLSFAKECRIFQKNNNTNLTIVTGLLTELGLRDFRDETERTLPKRNYVTIYNESYYDFIVRLLQEEGIIWRFEHTGKNHTLVFSDDTRSLPEIKKSSWLGADRMTGFCRRSRYNSLDGCQATDFEYDNPPEKLVGKAGKSPFRHFEYPGNFTARNEGEEKINRLKSVYRSDELAFHGTSGIRVLEAGKSFKMESPMLPEVHAQAFIIKKLFIEATPVAYENAFVAWPAKEPFYFSPDKLVSKPTIIGNQTAVVTGSKTASGVHTDSQGRVMVRFHWDRHSPAETGSAFIRNVMPAAGARRGFIFNPAVGDEVVVAFENGDPDRPLIIGKVYSTNQRTPVKPESRPEQSTINPRNEKNANSILFDDKNGAENLQINAKKDMKIKVGADLNINVDEDITILADNLEVRADGNVLTGNIITLSGGDITSIAGDNISNTTGLVVANIVGGLALNKAGANGINAALGMVDSSSGGQTISAAPIIFNTTAGSIDTNGKGGVKNLGLIVANTAMELIENSASKKVGQKADLAILTNTKTQTNTFDSESTTKALLVKDKGEMVINE